MCIFGTTEFSRKGDSNVGHRTKESLWVAVLIERGFPSEAKCFQDENSALRQERLWRKHINPDYDETGVLETKVELAFPRKSGRSVKTLRGHHE